MHFLLAISTNNTIDIISLSLSIFSTLIAILNIMIVVSNFLRVHFCSIHKRKKFSKNLSKKLKLISPDIILAPSINGVDIAKEIIDFSQLNYQLCPINLQWRYLANSDSDCDCCSSKFNISIPYKALNQSQRILIIDDVFITGETIYKTIESMISKGFNRKNIFTMGLIADNYSLKNLNIPDFYATNLNTSIYNINWRK